MKFYSETEITQIFEELDKDKAWLLEIKDNEFLQDHINYLENLLNSIIIVKE